MGLSPRANPAALATRQHNVTRILVGKFGCACLHLEVHLPHLSAFAKHPIYYFTAATEARAHVLADQAVFNCLTETWKKSAELDGWSVGRFVILPDHLHLFASPSEDAKARSQWIKMWKSVSARRLAREIGLTLPLWQPDTFDHILRDANSYGAKWEYVRNNPVRHGYVKRAEDWPWQGEINSFEFED